MDTDADATFDLRHHYGLVPRLVGRGYRVPSVDDLVRRLHTRIEDLSAELADVRAAIDVHEQHARDAMFLAQRIAAREAELDRRLVDDEALLAERRATAEVEARAIVAAAEEDAARIRSAAYHQAADVGRQMEILVTARGRTEAQLRALRDELTRVLDGDTVAARHEVLERQVSVHAGPFSNFVALHAFERELSTISGVEDVRVVSFEDDRAVIDLRVDHELPVGDVEKVVAPEGAVDVIDPRTIRVDLTGAEAG